MWVTILNCNNFIQLCTCSQSFNFLSVHGAKIDAVLDISLDHDCDHLKEDQLGKLCIKVWNIHANSLTPIIDLETHLHLQNPKKTIRFDKLLTLSFSLKRIILCFIKCVGVPCFHKEILILEIMSHSLRNKYLKFDQRYLWTSALWLRTEQYKKINNTFVFQLHHCSEKETLKVTLHKLEYQEESMTSEVVRVRYDKQ